MDEAADQEQRQRQRQLLDEARRLLSAVELAVSPDVAFRGGDNSAAFAAELLKPHLDAPPAFEGLASFLSAPPAAKIPITPHALSYARLDSSLAQHFTPASGKLAHAVACSLTSPLHLGESEAWTVCIENAVVISFLLELDKALPPDLSIGLKAERVQTDTPRLMTVRSAGGTCLRPDGLLRDTAGRGRVLARWEDGPAFKLQDTVWDLHKKTIWTPLYYGDLEYLLCFAAAGSELQFLAIARRCFNTHIPHPISRCFQLTDPDHRAEAIIATINFYRLLRAQRPRCPEAGVLPAGRERRAAHPDGLFVSSVLFRADSPVIRKRLAPWHGYAEWCGVELAHLQAVYRATYMKRGVVQAQDGPRLKDDGTYSVDLVPVGLEASDAMPTTEDDVRRLVGDLLHGLAAIHEAGFVHRDVRWDNIAWCQFGRTWFWIDLETCAPADQPPVPGFEPVGWQAGTTLVDGLYTCASDLYQLGLLVRQGCGSLLMVGSEAGRAFMDALLTAPAEQRCSARELLSHEWLRSPAGREPHE